MKNISTIVIIFILIGCNKHYSPSEKLLDEVEKIIEISPDSASRIIKSIPSPEELDIKSFARWCMLSGKITDKLFDTLLLTDQFEKAYSWYSTYGSPCEQIQILIYLGRSNATDGDYDKAMSIYTDALDIAKKNKLYNLSGYIYSYMGDLYVEKYMHTKAIDKYKIAAQYFNEANNKDSYACALRDLGREYACTDSINIALKSLLKADSISTYSINQNVKASIANTLGNIYAMQKNYIKAKQYLRKALFYGKNKTPNLLALADLYISTDSINKAKEILKETAEYDATYTYSIKYLYYQIYKSEENYKEALTYLEEYTDLIDSILYSDNQSKILNIETKYNHLKMKQDVNKLKLKQQSYIFATIICFLILLLVIIGYLLYRKKVKEKIHKQQTELNKMKIELLNLSIKLETKRNHSNTFKESDENYLKIQKEMEILLTNYKKLQNKILLDSPLYKKLLDLTNQHIPRNNKALITKEQWELITNEITSIYPTFYDYLYNLCPQLSEQDFQYCCFYMYGFDTNAEAKLLNIAPNSVRTKHLRLRQKLNITLSANTSLYDYLIENMHEYPLFKQQRT